MKETVEVELKPNKNLVKSFKTNFLINKNGEDKQQLKVALLNAFQTCGLEEWVTGQENYLTTVRCSISRGVITDSQLIDNYSQYFGVNDPAVLVKQFQRINSQKFDRKIVFSRGKVFKIKKELFIKAMGNKMEILRDYAQDKMVFLRNRVKYLIDSKNKSNF